MAVFPKRPDLRNEEETRQYIEYMVERIEFAVGEIQKAIRELQEGQNNG